MYGLAQQVCIQRSRSPLLLCGVFPPLACLQLHEPPCRGLSMMMIIIIIIIILVRVITTRISSVVFPAETDPHDGYLR